MTTIRVYCIVVDDCGVMYDYGLFTDKSQVDIVLDEIRDEWNIDPAEDEDGNESTHLQVFQQDIEIECKE